MRIKRTISLQAKKRAAIDKILEDHKDELPEEIKEQILRKRNQKEKPVVRATYEVLKGVWERRGVEGIKKYITDNNVKTDEKGNYFLNMIFSE